MRHPIKLQIRKRKDFGTFNRQYPIDNIIIDNFSAIKTEAQLAFYIFNKFGEGRFTIIAFQKGHGGFWCYWKGYLYSNGFIRDLNKNKELDNITQEINKSADYEEREFWEEELDYERQFSKEEKKLKRYGPIGLVTNRPGQMHDYQEIE